MMKLKTRIALNGVQKWIVKLLTIFLALAALLACRTLTGVPAQNSAQQNGGQQSELLPTEQPAPATISVTGEPLQTEPAGPPLQKRLVAYFASWNTLARDYPVSRIPAGKLTHLNYAFVALNDGTCTSTDPALDAANFTELRALKKAYPHLNTLISIGGGGTSGGFSEAARTEEARRFLVEGCVRFMAENGFDGVDIDWEFPEPEERGNFTALVTEFRKALDELGAASGGKRYLLTMAAGASLYQYNDIDLDQIAPALDWINLMTYSFRGKWSSLTGFISPLYAAPDDLAPSEVERQTFNIHSSVQAFLGKGVPADKIVVGVPFFGKGWEGVPDANQGLYQGFGNGPLTGRSYDYQELVEEYLIDGSGYTRHFHTEAQVPWLYNPMTGVMISYDDPGSLVAKTDYVKEQGLGGVMVWQLAADDEGHSLLNTLYTHLSGDP